MDPLENQYPWNSTYVFSENIVVNAVEMEGKEMTFSYSNISVENVSNNKSKIDVTSDVNLHIKVLNITKDKTKITGIGKIAQTIEKRFNQAFGNMNANTVFAPTHDLSGNPLSEPHEQLTLVEANATQRKFRVTMEIVDDISQINDDDYVIIFSDKESVLKRKHDPDKSVEAYAIKGGQATFINVKEHGVRKSPVGNEYRFDGSEREFANTITHEFAHMIGNLDDEYIDSKDGYYLPDQFKFNLMGNSNYTNLNSIQKGEFILSQLLNYNNYNRDGKSGTSGIEDTKEILDDEFEDY